MKIINFKIPTTWNSLTDKELINIALLFYTNVPEKIIDYKLFQIFTDYKWYKFKLYRKINKLFKLRTVSNIKEHFQFIYRNQNLTRFVAKVKINRKPYFAPADKLKNLTIGEFSVTEDLYLGYLRNAKNKNANYGESYLRHLFAVLYSEVPYKRPDFHKDELSKKVVDQEKIQYKYLLTTLLSYMRCREQITSNKKYSHIFPKQKESTTPEDSKTNEIPKSSGYSNIIMGFSSKIFGDYNATFNTNLYTFLDGYELFLANQPKDKQ